MKAWAAAVLLGAGLTGCKTVGYDLAREGTLRHLPDLICIERTLRAAEDVSGERTTFMADHVHGSKAVHVTFSYRLDHATGYGWVRKDAQGVVTFGNFLRSFAPEPADHGAAWRLRLLALEDRWINDCGFDLAAAPIRETFGTYGRRR